jgi:anti-sigma regulatory factor (Ser/Thr protein kinase)
LPPSAPPEEAVIPSAALVESDNLVLVDQMEELGRAGTWLAGRLRALALPEETAFSIRLCVDEALANVVMHAFDDDGTNHPILLRVQVDHKEVVVIIEDRGRPFDPLAGETPALPSTVEDAAIGGRGLRLIRCYAGRLAYARSDGRNLLTMAFARPTGQIEGR